MARVAAYRADRAATGDAERAATKKDERAQARSAKPIFGSVRQIDGGRDDLAAPTRAEDGEDKMRAGCSHQICVQVIDLTRALSNRSQVLRTSSESAGCFS